MTVTIRQVTRWIVLCVAGVVLCDVPGPDRPDITLLSTENLQTCVAASNTNGYGLTFMSATLSETEHEVFVCEFQSRHFGCSFEFQVMRIDYALYGRNSRENCPSPGHDQNTQCTSSGAIEIVRSRCEGRRYCTVSADNRLFGDPCSGVLKFLQVQYTCVLVPEFKYTDGSGAIKDVSSDCDFEDTSGCWRNWHHTGISLQTSGLFPLSPVTDERWNSFEVYRTVGQSHIKPNYKKKYDIQENFFIGFSVRSTENAQILLCSTQYPASSPCYWIIIDGYTSTGYTSTGYTSTGIRKCIQGVPDTWAKTLDCKIFRDNITIPEKLLNESMWTHFMVSREDSNRIRLWLWDLSTGLRPLLDYTDDHPLPLSYMFLRSYHAIADWKVHKYKYITIPNTKSSVRLGPPLKFKHLSPLCVSLYATICSQCKLDIKLEREDGTIQMESSIEGDSDGPFMKWRNVRLQGGISTSSSTHYQLYLALNTRNGTDDNTFWAIDDFRTCLHNEIRVAQAFSYTTLLCQSLKHPGWIFNRLNKVENDHEPPICPDGRYIGQHCNISFSSVIPKSGYTENQKICMPTQKENSKGSCTCVAGYTWVSGCVNQCSSGYYGYDCKNKCGMCKNNYNCNRITGICPAGCKDRYLPPYCQISKCFKIL